MTEYTENKTLDKLMQRLTDNGEPMIAFDSCYADYGCFGEGTKSHWICLTESYRFYDGLVAIHEQTPSMVCELKNGQIYKLEKPEVVGEHNCYIKDSNGKDKNFNPFSNGTYRRVKRK
jgi:hypothetical protein